MFFPFKKIKKIGVEDFIRVEDSKQVEFLKGYNVLPASYDNGVALFIKCQEVCGLLEKYEKERCA